MLRRSERLLLRLVPVLLTPCAAADREGTPRDTSVVTRPASAKDDEGWASVRKETLRTVWLTVNESYFDETFGGVNWRAVGERYRDLLPTIADNDALRHQLQTMLAELGRSHFAILPREAAVFHPSERTRIGTTGAEVAYVDGQVVVARVSPGSAADRAGLKAGARVSRIGDYNLVEIAQAMRRMNLPEAQMGRNLSALANAHLAAAVGQTIALEVEVENGATEKAVFDIPTEAHEGAWSEPLGNFPSMPLQCEARRGDDGMAYLRFNAFVPALMKQVRVFLRSLQSGDGLVLDLRGNPGGVADMASGIGGLLVDRELPLGGVRLRKGATSYVAYPQERAFLGPLAILVDGGSASTSEILAAGLRDHGRARLFGERTAGAALPSAFRTLPNGDLLQYAVADLRTPKGSTIEGRGVEPDVVVQRAANDYAAGRDVALEAAKSWLAGQRALRAGEAPPLATRQNP